MIKAPKLIVLAALCLVCSETATQAAGGGASSGVIGGAATGGTIGGAATGATIGGAATVGTGLNSGGSGSSGALPGNNPTGINQPGTPSEQTQQPNSMNTNPRLNTH
jgi:hypothetical protein